MPSNETVKNYISQTNFLNRRGNKRRFITLGNDKISMNVHLTNEANRIPFSLNGNECFTFVRLFL